MQTTTKFKLRTIFDRQSLKKKNAIREILMQRVQNSVNMNQLKISWNVHFVNDVFCDNIENLSMHELQIDLVTIRRFNLAIEIINFIMIYLISIELMIILKLHFSILSKIRSVNIKWIQWTRQLFIKRRINSLSER
jgi:hypothetical protein